MQGSCCCGVVRFELTAPPTMMATCHCSRCRKVGASTFVFVKAEDVAWLSGRDYVTPDDVKALARPALRHRVELRAEAEIEGVTADAVLDGVLGSVAVPR